MDREYLNDSAFLRTLDDYRNKFGLVKIIVLDMQEKPISEIHGRVEDGASINIDGSSAVRRTCSLTFVAIEEENDLTNVENLLSINKKVKIEVGIVNNFHNDYKDVDVFWFPQGIFVIEDPSISNGPEGCTISIECKDKMALLNGECGGNLPASITFHEYDQVVGTMEVTTWPTLQEGTLNNYTIYDFGKEVNGSQLWRWSKTEGFYPYTKPEKEESLLENEDENSEEDEEEVLVEHIPNLIYDIIQTLVCNYGGESLDKIIINDIPLQIKQVVRNTSSNSMYYNPYNKVYTLNQSHSADTSGDWLEFENGVDCGYVYTDFTYPGELISGIGENVCSVLDKIKDVLGNFEYFYDLDGNFVFQEKKNYLNVSYLPVANAKMLTPLDYTAAIFGRYLSAIDTIPTDSGREQLIVETLNNYNLLSDDTHRGVNYSITYPSVEHITKKILISYMYESHSWEIVNNLYLIDQNNYLVDYNSNKKSVYNFDVDNGTTINFSNSPSYTNIKNDFHVWGKSADGKTAIHYHLAIKSKPKVMTPRKVVLTSDNQLKVVGAKDSSGQYYIPTDWRVEIYLQGKEKIYLHERPDIYEQEMLDLLPLIYTFEEQDGKIVGKYKEDVTKVNNLTYFVDYLEPVEELYDISVDLIGPRIYSYQQDNIIKLFDNDIPNVIIVNKDGDRIYNQQIIEKCKKEGQPYVNVDSIVFSNLAEETLGYSAQEVARDLLYQYTDYNSVISFSCMPIFYLEPNTRITVRDKKSGIYGDYIISSISRPLGCQGTMSISATRALERI